MTAQDSRGSCGAGGFFAIASRWLAKGSYEPIARTAFRKIKAPRLLLEYDDARSGSFEPLRHIPEDRTVVLGLVTTKRPRLETREELTERIREASRHVPLERLALSPQCGFASSVMGTESHWRIRSANCECWWRRPEQSGTDQPYPVLRNQKVESQKSEQKARTVGPVAPRRRAQIDPRLHQVADHERQIGILVPDF